MHERAKTKFGGQNPLTYSTLTNWARTQYESGQFEEALVNLTQSHASLLKLVGAESPHTQDAVFKLASVELALGHVEAASQWIAMLDAKILESSRARLSSLALTLND